MPKRRGGEAALGPEVPASPAYANGHLQDRTIELSTGVVLRYKSVSQSLLARIYEQAPPRPEPPLVEIGDKGVSERNLSDPGYAEAMNDWANARLIQINKAFFMLGTEVESLPDGVPGPDDNSWIEDVEAVGVTVGQTRQERYYAWCLMVACRGVDDGARVVREVAQLSGVLEQHVASAGALFRR